MRLFTSLALISTLFVSSTLLALGAPLPISAEDDLALLSTRAIFKVTERQQEILMNAWAIIKDISEAPRYLSDLSDRTGLSQDNVKTWFKNMRAGEREGRVPSPPPNTPGEEKPNPLVRGAPKTASPGAGSKKGPPRKSAKVKRRA